MRSPLMNLVALCALWAPMALLAPQTHAASAAGASMASTAASARVIVKFKSDSALLRRQALSVSLAAQVHSERAQALGLRIGLALKGGAGVADRTQVVTANGISSEQLAARLSKQSDVEYAVVDQRRHRFTAPNDPLYTSVGGNGPATGQWYLRAPTLSVPASINAEGAWGVTTGTSSIVVAVIDTGVRFDHRDLAGRLYPGYDFISDAPTANDGDGRDADASDPGDWVSQEDVAAGGTFASCDLSDSSWHGTQVSGLIGAATNNGFGMASSARNVMILPVRVLGKCGGFDSDIIAGMRWAAGLPVPGVPDNAHPARVLNLSLGGSGTCDSSTGYPDAVAAINAAGAVIVASAGNGTGHAVNIPANCAGVIGVGGLRHVGTKVGYSDLGPEVSLSAPAGNCVNTTSGSPCLYPLLTSVNAGTTSPVAGSSLFTDGLDHTSLGTSFSAPLVAGTAALMLSVKPTLTPAQVLATLRSTARTFPTTGGDNGDGSIVAQCTAPNSVDQSQCYCTTTTCGAGMLDANAAVRAVLPSQAPTVPVTSSDANPTVGTTVTLDGSAALPSSGHSIATYQWALGAGSESIAAFTSATDGSTVTLVPTGAGTVTASLTVTDDVGSRTSAQVQMTVSAGPAAMINPSPASGVAGSGVVLDASSSSASGGRSIAQYQWAITSGANVSFATDPTASSVTLLPTAAGTVVVALTVTDSAGEQASSSTTITVQAAPPPSDSGGGALGVIWLVGLASAIGALRACRRPSGAG